MKKVLRKLSQKSTGHLASNLINIELVLRSRGRVLYDSENDIYFANIPEGHGKFYSPYAYNLGMEVRKWSVTERVTKLAERYSLDQFDVADGDVIVDVGANIGKIGMYYTLAKGKQIRYYGLEPMERECKCCKLNNPQGKVFQKALWEEGGKFKFYKENQGGNDSSFIEPVRYDAITEIEAVTLDSFVEQEKIKKIKVLKMDTEGAEPEVIRGGEKVLDRIEYIAASLGAERGPHMAHTLPEFANYLYPKGFKMTGMTHKGATKYLFKNTKYK